MAARCRPLLSCAALKTMERRHLAAISHSPLKPRIYQANAVQRNLTQRLHRAPMVDTKRLRASVNRANRGSRAYARIANAPLTYIPHHTPHPLSIIQIPPSKPWRGGILPPFPIPCLVTAAPRGISDACVSAQASAVSLSTIAKPLRVHHWSLCVTSA